MSNPQGRRGAGRGRKLIENPPPGASNSSINDDSKANSTATNQIETKDSAPIAAGRGRGYTPRSTDPTPTPGSTASAGSPKRVVDDLVEKTQNLEIIDLAKRPGFGAVGSKMMVFANYYEVAMKDELRVTQYHIDVNHEFLKLTRDDKRICFLKCMKDHPRVFVNPYSIAYDGDHLCFSNNRLVFPDRKAPGLHIFEIKLRLPRMEREELIKVQFQMVGLVHVTTRTVKTSTTNERYTTPMHILDILFRQQRSGFSEAMAAIWYPYGPTTYKIPENGGTEMTLGRVIWQGLFGAAHVGQNYSPYINFDVSHSGFYKPQAVIEFMIGVLNDKFSDRRGPKQFSVQQLTPETKLNPQWIEAINRELKGLKVVTEISKSNGESYEREYRVNGLIQDSAITKQFDMRLPNGTTQKTSVAAYFKERYGSIRYPNLNLLHVGSRKRECYIPMEACRIALCQRVNKKLNPDQLNIMIKAAAINAPNRRGKICELVRDCGFGQDPWLKEFGITINTDMKQVESRVLSAPKILFANTRTVDPRDGVWELRGQKFFLPAGCNTIGALVIDDRDHNMYKEFFNFLLRTCNEMGMHLPAEISVKAIRAISPNVAAEIEPKMTELVNMGCTFIIVTLPQKSSVFYSEVKRVAEIVLGVMTQCVVKSNIAKTMQKMDRMTTTNIALKVNTKLGGINSKAQFDALTQKSLAGESTLILGIDVTHPSPLEHRAPSVASVVGNLDDSFMRYAASVRVQKHRREMMVYLQDPVRERLIEYFAYSQEENEKRRKAGQPVKTDLKPARLIVYRDGVAESQFQEVMREEMSGIREACKQLGADYRPKITLIVAQKRHHARFFPTSQQTACGRALNVKPGTVVEKDITHPEQFEFYLCSHFGIQGTSRPIRYHVLHDDSNFSADTIQAMTYYLCHLYARCARTVSIPAPIYYADLACRRARAHLYDKIADFGGETITDRSSTTDEGTGISESEMIKSSTVAEALKMTMYFT